MTTPPPDETGSLRHEIHMQMLGKSESAKNLGELTVVPLGFAVDVALSVAAAKAEEAARVARIDELSHWASFFDDSNMNAMTPSDRLRKRIRELHPDPTAEGGEK